MNDEVKNVGQAGDGKVKTGSPFVDRRSAFSKRLGERWYDFVYSLVFGALHVGWSYRFEGRRNLPRTGPVLLVANHQSFFDPAIATMASHRRLTYLARKTLFRNPLFSWYIASLNSIPVDQEGMAKEGLKAILAKLREGAAVLIFPEGERTWDGQMQPFKAGIHLLIKRARVPVVPIGIAGGYEALPRTCSRPHFSPLFLPATTASLAASVGKPLDGSKLAELPREKLLSELYQEVKRLAERAERLRRK